MQVISFLKNVEFLDNKPSISVMMDNEFSKEVRIAFKKNQAMKEHKSRYPITLMCIQGEIKFTAKGEVFILSSGDTISLEAHIIHGLEALEQSITRLNLHKYEDNKINSVLIKK
jgi:quercetin dioxygenase-like cupin family protein